MENQRTWLFPSTPSSTVLRMRPRALEIFERHGMEPWGAPHNEIGDLCRSVGLSWETFRKEMAALPSTPEFCDWDVLPLSHLLDALSRDHWEFVQELMPAIQLEFTNLPLSSDESLRRLRYLAQDWPAFSSSLIAHIREEETFLFPKILQYDHCVRHKEHHPDFTGGSVNVFVALRMLDNEKRQMEVIRRFLDEVHFTKDQEKAPGTLESRLLPLLERFQERLIRHANLENDVLYPRTRALEKALYDARIGGKTSA